MNNMVLNNEWVSNKIKEKSKDTSKLLEMRTNNPKFVGHEESNTKREIHSITGLFPKKKKERKEERKG